MAEEGNIKEDGALKWGLRGEDLWEGWSALGCMGCGAAEDSDGVERDGE